MMYKFFFAKDRIHTINDVPNLGIYFFRDPDFTTVAAEELFNSVPPVTYSKHAAWIQISSLWNSFFLRIGDWGVYKSDRKLAGFNLWGSQIWRDFTAFECTTEIGALQIGKGINESLATCLDWSNGQLFLCNQSKFTTETDNPQVGAGVPATMGTLGKAKSLDRLRHALELVK